MTDLKDFIPADEYLQNSKNSSSSERSLKQTGSDNARTSEPVSEPLTMYVSTSEKKILLTIGKLEQGKHPNINNKTLSKKTGYSISYTSEILASLRKKGLIETIDQKVQKIHKLSSKGQIAVFRSSAGYCGDRTSQYDKTTGKWKIRVRPHDFRFKAEVLSGPPYSEKWMPTYHLDGLIGVVCYEYETTCMFFTSEKTSKRYVVLRVPSFFTENLEMATFEAHEKAFTTLQKLSKDYGYKFSDLIHTYGHVAITEDPVTYHCKEDIGFVESKSKRLRVDSSPGFAEFEATGKLAQEDLEKIYDEVFDPIVQGEYSILTMLTHLRIMEKQIRTDQLIFADNLKEHVSLVTYLKNASHQLEKATNTLAKYAESMIEEKQKEKEKKEKSLLSRIKNSGQKLLEDWI